MKSILFFKKNTVSIQIIHMHFTNNDISQASTIFKRKTIWIEMLSLPLMLLMRSLGGGTSFLLNGLAPLPFASDNEDWCIRCKIRFNLYKISLQDQNIFSLYVTSKSKRHQLSVWRMERICRVLRLIYKWAY